MAKKILVVEDEKDILNLIRRVLLRENYTVICAETGEEAFQELYDKGPDLLLLDINLPDISGWEICKKIRKDPLFKNIPIIMLTIRSSTEDKVKGLNLGADDYIPKPFSPKELLARIKKLL